MRHRYEISLVLLMLSSGCALERIEAMLTEHGVTDNTTSDAAVGSTGNASTTMDASTANGEAGYDASDSGTTMTSMTSTSSTSGTTGSADATTAGAQSVCGNGVLEPIEPFYEECDDGNLIPDDGCNATCDADRTIFVSSIRYQAGDFEGLYFADGLCANMAVQVGFPEPLKFRAWLSDSETHARDRFEFGRGRIVLVNGIVVADSWIDLLAGKLKNPIEVTEKSETYHGAVWTGTDPQGVGIVGAKHCEDWTSVSADDTAYYGYSDRITAEWTLAKDFDNPFPCGGDFAVYCLEEG